MIFLENRTPWILQCLLWIIPINIYVIGDWWGSGIQWAIFRYQQAFYNNEYVTTMVFFNREIHWILTSVITGKTVLSIILWGFGILFLISATLLLISILFTEKEQHLQIAALLNIASAIVFAIAIFILYGLTLNGPAGIAIPFGIPVILGVAYYQYFWVNDSIDDEKSDDDIDFTEKP